MTAIPPAAMAAAKAANSRRITTARPRASRVPTSPFAATTSSPRTRSATTEIQSVATVARKTVRPLRPDGFAPYLGRSAFQSAAMALRPEPRPATTAMPIRRTAVRAPVSWSPATIVRPWASRASNQYAATASSKRANSATVEQIPRRSCRTDAKPLTASSTAMVKAARRRAPKSRAVATVLGRRRHVRPPAVTEI